MNKVHRASTIPTMSGSGPRTSVMYWVYILKSEKSKTYYVGCTDNIARRMKEHNNGLSKYTRNKGPWNLVYQENFFTLREARTKESKIKSWKKRVVIEKLINGSVV